MPAYSVYRPSVLRSGRLAVRAAAVAALLVASVTAAVVLTHTGGAQSPAGAKAPTAKAGAQVKTAHVAKTVAAKAHVDAKAKAKVATIVHHPKTLVATRKAVIPTPRSTPVAVLNGGTSQGAAAATASRLRAYGYPVPLVGNAGSRDLPSAIEYTQGLGAAARALARKIGPVSYVTPFDGPQRNLSGARLLVIIGS
jgi:hypothetical protein